MQSLPYPDAELAVIAITTAEAPTVTVLPDGYDPATDGELVQVVRVGGAPDIDDITDNPLVQVTCWAGTRSAAWALSNRCQVRMLSAAGQAVDAPGDLADGVLVDDCEIAAGNQLIPDINPDDRKVATTYRLAFRRQYHLVPQMPSGLTTVTNSSGVPEPVVHPVG